MKYLCQVDFEAEKEKAVEKYLNEDELKIYPSTQIACNASIFQRRGNSIEPVFFIMEVFNMF
jgi:hypothetical protein